MLVVAAQNALGNSLEPRLGLPKYYENYYRSFRQRSIFSEAINFLNRKHAVTALVKQAAQTLQYLRAGGVADESVLEFNNSFAPAARTMDHEY